MCVSVTEDRCSTSTQDHAFENQCCQLETTEAPGRKMQQVQGSAWSLVVGECARDMLRPRVRLFCVQQSRPQVNTYALTIISSNLWTNCWTWAWVPSPGLPFASIQCTVRGNATYGKAAMRQVRQYHMRPCYRLAF